ncbi:MAG TPA: hypothetical protein VGL38_01015 [bacterium]|jgi:hypothetical protein
MDWYIQWVTGSPFTSAAIQFALLGTLGELLSFWLRVKQAALPCSLTILLGKIAAWAVLGIIIKLGFTGMRGFVASLNEHSLVPEFLTGTVGMAFVLSVNTNLFFGPQMMFIHRVEENLLARRWDMAGIQKAWLTLLWFWIPAHTITFSLPKDFQIGLAALWSVALGLIMGLTAPKKTA